VRPWPLNFPGRLYPLVMGGVSYGFTFGDSLTDFVGTVSNIRTPYDVSGVYAAAGAGAAIGVGGGVIVLTNQNGAVLTLSSTQAGLIVAADLDGLVISIRSRPQLRHCIPVSVSRAGCSFVFGPASAPMIPQPVQTIISLHDFRQRPNTQEVLAKLNGGA
jgi:hypothetical protein